MPVPRRLTDLTEPIPTLTPNQVRELDRIAIEQLGIPGVVLMENAAAALEESALELLPHDPPQALILLGPGNNGGDGLALARRLHARRWNTRLVSLCPLDRHTGDAAINARITRAMRTELAIASHTPADQIRASLGEPQRLLVVDALFGTGLSRPLEGQTAELVQLANALRDEGATLLAADVPSGLDALTGTPIGDHCIRANRTVTFAALKPGLRAPGADRFTGEVVAASIGVPAELARRVHTR